MNQTICCLLFVLFLSCNGEGDKESKSLGESDVSSTDTTGRLIRSALDSGNFKAYNKAAYYYLINARSEEFLYPAFIMANKYDNPEAFYHVFQILNGPLNGGEIDSLDMRTKNLAIFYLLKSYEMGYERSEFEIRELFKNVDSIPSSSNYLQQFCSSMLNAHK